MNFARSVLPNIVPIVARDVVVVERERDLLPVLVRPAIRSSASRPMKSWSNLT